VSRHPPPLPPHHASPWGLFRNFSSDCFFPKLVSFFPLPTSSLFPSHPCFFCASCSFFPARFFYACYLIQFQTSHRAPFPLCGFLVVFFPRKLAPERAADPPPPPRPFVSLSWRDLELCVMTSPFFCLFFAEFFQHFLFNQRSHFSAPRLRPPPRGPFFPPTSPITHASFQAPLSFPSRSLFFFSLPFVCLPVDFSPPSSAKVAFPLTVLICGVGPPFLSPFLHLFYLRSLPPLFPAREFAEPPLCLPGDCDRNFLPSLPNPASFFPRFLRGSCEISYFFSWATDPRVVVFRDFYPSSVFFHSTSLRTFFIFPTSSFLRKSCSLWGPLNL